MGASSRTSSFSRPKSLVVQVLTRNGKEAEQQQQQSSEGRRAAAAAASGSESAWAAAVPTSATRPGCAA
jgi:hypothetical protein